MEHLNNIIKFSAMGREGRNHDASVNGSEKSDERTYEQNILRLSRGSSAAKMHVRMKAENMSTKIYSFARLLEKVENGQIDETSNFAALAAKLSIYAQELGMSQSMTLAQKLGENAMDGNMSGCKTVKQLLNDAALSELARLP